MSEPARHDHPEMPATPHHPAWADFRRAMIAEARAARLVIGQLAAYPGDPAVLEMARAILEVLEIHAEIGRRCLYNEEKLAALVEERVEEELARHGIQAGCLHAVPAPR